MAARAPAGGMAAWIDVTGRLLQGILGPRWAARAVPWALVAVALLEVAIGVAVAGSFLLPVALLAGLAVLAALLVWGEYWGVVAWFALSPWLQPFADDYLRIGTPVTFDRLLFPAVVAAFVARRAIAGREPRIGWVEAAMAFFVVTYGLSLTYAYDPYKSGVALLQHYMLPFATYLVVIGVVDSPRRLRTLLAVNVANSALLGLVGIFERFSGVSLFTGSLEFADIYLGRAAGPFVNPAVYGVVLAMMALLAFHSALHARTRLRALLASAAIALALTGIFFTYTRSAWLSLVIGLAVVGLVDGRLRLPLALAFLVGGLFVAQNWSAVVEDPDLYRRLADPTNAYGRVDTAELQWQAFWRSPIVGNGPGAFNADNRVREGWVSHNTLLTILVDNGLLGLAAFVATGLLAVGRTLRAYLAFRPGSPERGLVAAAWGGGVAYLTTAMLIDDTYFVFPTALFWVLLAMPVVALATEGSR